MQLDVLIKCTYLLIFVFFVLDGDAGYVGGYQPYVGSTFNYAMFYVLQRVFAQKVTMTQIPAVLAWVQSSGANLYLMGNFIDNHDQPRFLSFTSDKTLLYNGLMYITFASGIPFYYYGTEQGFNGGNDPANREDLWRSGYNTATTEYQYIKSLLKIRKTVGVSNLNTQLSIQEHLLTTDSVYVFSRMAKKVIVFTTNQGSGSSWKGCLDANVVPTGKYVNLQDGTDSVSVSFQSDFKFCTSLVNGMPKVYFFSD